jgi:hypothetical protein
MNTNSIGWKENKARDLIKGLRLGLKLIGLMAILTLVTWFMGL